MNHRVLRATHFRSFVTTWCRWYLHFLRDEEHKNRWSMTQTKSERLIECTPFHFFSKVSMATLCCKLRLTLEKFLQHTHLHRWFFPRLLINSFIVCLMVIFKRSRLFYTSHTRFHFAWITRVWIRNIQFSHDYVLTNLAGGGAWR